MTVPSRPYTDPAWPLLGDAAIRAVTLLGFLHSLTSVLLGGGLAWSWVAGYEVTAPSYVLLESIPFWPLSVGLVFMVTGAVQFWFRRSDGLWRLSCWSYVIQGGLASLYSALLSYGAFISSPQSLYGPQFLYVGYAMTSIALALFMHGAYRIMHKGGESGAV